MRIITEPQVFLIGYPQFDVNELAKYNLPRGVSDAWMTGTATPAERLVEIGGRCCYDSFANPRPGGNPAYIQRILEQGHGRVLEHATFTFLFADVSRALTHELYTHCVGFSKSMRSTRYCDESEAGVVLPPHLIEDYPIFQERLDGYIGPYSKEEEKSYERVREWYVAMQEAFLRYQNLLADLTGEGKTFADLTTDEKKKVRQTARYVLPHSLATVVCCTVNARAIRHAIEVRVSRHADAEIRNLFYKVWSKVVQPSPTIFGDYTPVALEDGTFELMTPYRKV